MTPPARRVVRAVREFFDDLDRQLPAERTSRAPSRSDFQAYDLLRTVEEFAVGWDALPEMISGRPEYRLLIAAGRVVHAVSVVGQLASDGAVELVGIDIDATSPWGDEPDGE